MAPHIYEDADWTSGFEHHDPTSVRHIQAMILSWSNELPALQDGDATGFIIRRCRLAKLLLSRPGAYCDSWDGYVADQIALQTAMEFDAYKAQECVCLEMSVPRPNYGTS
jgi:hypothetical protein